ncbi:unnamed protein product, partial [marine sediment metagenome]
LTFRCNVSTSVTLSGLREAREMAGKFLSEFADVELAASDELQAAARLYEQEVGILSQAQSKAPFCMAPEEERLKMAERGLREFLADHILQAKDNGQSWKKEGHFGIGVPYFVFQAPEDGTYGICIIGLHRPDLAPANLQIQHVQVVDSTAPQIEVSISPEEAPYWVGQRIWLTWKITDAHLVKAPGKLYSKVVDSDKPTPWELLKTGMASSGTVRVTIEQMPQRAEGVLFRIEATDKMGSIGVGYSKMLEVLPSVSGTEVKEPRSTTFVIPGGEEQP